MPLPTRLKAIIHWERSILLCSDNGVTKVGTGQANGRATNLFEPADEYKGDFARMYLYFVTCYQDYSWKSSALSMFAQNSYPTLNAYGQSLLLKWHRQDPVSQKEIDRNNAVYSFQGNRNPFIDYPNMVEYIWGDSTNYEFSFSGQSTSAQVSVYRTTKSNSDTSEPKHRKIKRYTSKGKI